jgi:dCTP deaminase
MGFVLHNASKDYLRLSTGDIIAKAEFVKLTKPVSKGYSGQHGFETETWPLSPQYVATSEDLKKAGIYPDSIQEIRHVHGGPIADAVEKLRYYEKKVWIQISVTVVGFAAILYFAKDIGAVNAILFGVTANLITTLGISLAGRWWRKR